MQQYHSKSLNELLLTEEALEVDHLPDGQHKERRHGHNAEEEQAVVRGLCMQREFEEQKYE